MLNGTKGKAVFLDRDGVLNRELGNYVTGPHEFEILPHVMPACRRLADAGFQLIVITNQGGIAKSLYTHEILHKTHELLRNEFIKNKLPLTDILYCPHHPEFTRCLCRKPGSLMIERALARYHLDEDRSFMIGDTERDILAAASAGVKGFMVASNADWTSTADLIINS